MKKLSLAFMLVLFALGSALAQRTLMGTITDTEGEALIGANILVKGTTIGTVTDVEGKYTLEIPADATTLVLSYTGYETQEKEIGASNQLDVTMAEGLNLTEVVVTGLGIKKEKKALGYAITTIGSADVELKPEADVGRILRGKVPGVDITSTSGLSGSGTNIIIRGYSSITGSNQPLFVVDGVPFNTDTNSDREFTAGGASASSRFLDLDPNTIKEISVLKGLSATVLYGEAGRNGVVLVTTKNGDIGDLDKKFEVTVSQSVFASQVAGIPETQKSYGNGWQGDASNAFSNWGAPFPSDPTFAKNINGITNGGSYQLDADGTIVHPYSIANFASAFPELQGTRIPWEAHDALATFLGGTGLSTNTSINIANKISDGSALNFSYSLFNDEGFVPNNDLQRHNFGLGINTKLNNGLSVISSFNFTTSERNTPPAAPIYSSNPISGASLFSNVLYTPVSHDLYGWPYENPIDGSSVYYRSNNSIQNPRWTSENTNDNEKIRRFFGNVNLGYKLTDWLNVNYRFGMDTYAQTIRYQINKGGIQLPDGLLVTSNRLNFITDQTLNFSYNYQLNDDWSLDGVLGANFRREKRDQNILTSTQQFITGLNTHDNFITHDNLSFITIENTLGAYLTMSAGYKNFLYVNFQGRNDWTSTLEPENRSVFYPSGSVAFIPTEIIPALQNSNMVNYLKLRVGYGTSAGYPDPYSTRNTLGSVANRFVTGGTGTVINTNTISNTFGNAALTHEKHRELEIGVEGKFFKNRVGIDFSFYDKESSDLIIELELDPSTGGTESTLNTAKLENVGFEVGLNFRPIVTSSFAWDFAINYTRNRNKVLAIADGNDQVLIDGLNFLGNFAMAPVDPTEEGVDARNLPFGVESGGMVFFPYGAIQGSRILRTEDGTPILGSDGLYQADPNQGVIGDPNADFDMNFINTFSFKGVALRVQFDWQQGGDIWGSTASTLTARGIAGETDFDRFVPVVVPGVLDNGDGTYRPNDIQVSANNAYWRNTGVWFDENRIFDATTVRLREISLSYSLPSSLLKNTPLGSLSFTLSGQNMWYKAVNFPESINFDPEVLSLGVGNGQGFDFVTGPTSKRYGASIKLTF